MSPGAVGPKPGFGRVFAAPLAIAVVSAFGLVAAFGFGETGRVLCWFGVGAPIVVIGWCALRQRARFESERRHRPG